MTGPSDKSRCTAPSFRGLCIFPRYAGVLHVSLLPTTTIFSTNSTFSHPCRQSEDMLLWRIGLGTSVLVDELATSKQLSYNIVFLILYCIAYPKCSAAQINVYLHNVNYRDVLIKIPKAERHIKLTRKCSSSTGYQAFLPKST
ncbi:LOW QUALITY PROTEIN: hypothetical protein ACHAXN_006710 [Cyclotella atomus]